MDVVVILVPSQAAACDTRGPHLFLPICDFWEALSTLSLSNADRFFRLFKNTRTDSFHKTFKPILRNTAALSNRYNCRLDPEDLFSKLSQFLWNSFCKKFFETWVFHLMSLLTGKCFRITNMLICAIFGFVRLVSVFLIRQLPHMGCRLFSLESFWLFSTKNSGF